MTRKQWGYSVAAGIVGIFAAYGANLVNNRDYEIFQQNQKESAMRAMEPFLAKALKNDTCDTDNEGIAGQVVDYKAHGKRLFGLYLHRQDSYLVTRKLGGWYYGGTADAPAGVYLALGGDDRVIGGQAAVFATPSEACQRKLLAQYRKPETAQP